MSLQNGIQQVDQLMVPASLVDPSRLPLGQRGLDAEMVIDVDRSRLTKPSTTSRSDFPQPSCMVTPSTNYG